MSDLFALNSKKCLIDISGKILESSIIPTPTTLSDGSVIVYDRGEQYGEYNLTDGVLTRISEGEDSGSYDDINWRYLIVDNEDLLGNNSSSGNKYWGEEEITNYNKEDIGYGLYYSNLLLEKYSTEEFLWFNLNKRRETSNYNWFLPSNDEILLLYTFRNEIPNLVTLNNTYYYSCNESPDVFTDCCCGLCFYGNNAENTYISTEYGKWSWQYGRVRLMRRI